MPLRLARNHEVVVYNRSQLMGELSECIYIYKPVICLLALVPSQIMTPITNKIRHFYIRLFFLRHSQVPEEVSGEGGAANEEELEDGKRGVTYQVRVACQLSIHSKCRLLTRNVWLFEISSFHSRCCMLVLNVACSL